MASYLGNNMLKKELKQLAKHKSVETTKEVTGLVSNVEEGVPTSKIVVTFTNGETRLFKVGNDTTNKEVKKWLLKVLPNTAMIEVYTKDHPNKHVKDTYHRLGGLPDLWTLFLIFENGEII